MSKIKEILIILFILSYSLSAQIVINQSQEEKIQLALKEMYNRNLKESNKIFQDVLGTEPFHPLAPLGSLATQWMINQEIQGFKTGNEALLKEINSTLKIYKDQISRNPEESQLSFYYGSTMGLKSRVLLFKKDWLGVLLTGYKCMRYIKLAAKQNPDLLDVYLPIGVFNYYVGVSSSYMKIASWILGESGSREEGLQQMSLSAKSNGYGRYEARGILAFVYLYMEEDYAASLEFSTMLSEEFPANPYYHFLIAEALISLHQYKKADIHINKIRSLLSFLEGNTLNEFILKLHLLDGTMALHKKDLSTAERELKTVIDTYDIEMDWHLSYTYMRLGNVYDLQGQREEAKKYYIKAVELDNRSHSCKLSKTYLKKPYSYDDVR